MCTDLQNTPPAIGFFYALKRGTPSSLLPTHRVFSMGLRLRTSARWKMIDSSLRRVPLCICALASLFLLAGCSLKQDMALQPKDRPLWPSDFFTDGRSARPLVENTVARGSVEGEMAGTKESNAFPLPVN